MKTEFLVQLDGAATNNDARVVILGATNRPDELDEAARRRFVKRIYIPLPDFDSRSQLVNQLLSTTVNELTQQDILSLVHRTDGFSGADIRSLCTEAAMGPMRELATRHSNSLQQINAHDVPPISMRHLEEALENVQPSVSPNDLQRYLDWNATYGSFRNINA